MLRNGYSNEYKTDNEIFIIFKSDVPLRDSCVRQYCHVKVGFPILDPTPQTVIPVVVMPNTRQTPAPRTSHTS